MITKTESGGMIYTGDDVIAFKSCIQHGNHNNVPLIDRQVFMAASKLWAMQARFIDAVRAIDTSPNITLGKVICDEALAN